MKDAANEMGGFENLDNEEIQKAAGKGKNVNIESINPVEVSKKILLNCNFIKAKPLSVRTLHSGEGHLSMLPLKSVREIYHDVFHKDIVPLSPLKDSLYT